MKGVAVILKKHKKSKYNLLYNLDNGSKVLFNTRTLALSVIDNQEYLQYEAAEIYDVDIEKEKLFKSLYEDGFIVDYETDELAILKYRLNSQRYSKDILRLTIAPTMDCNFNCFYCYEKEIDSDKNTSMSVEVQDQLLDFIKKRSENIRELNIVWYGGEPLLSFEIIKNLSNSLIELCNSKEINYSSMMVTNGYLLDHFDPEEIIDIGIETIQITIDGPEKIHNERRVLLNGKKTYNKLIENINKYQESIDIVIRINVDKSNASSLETLLEEFKKHNINKVMINLAPVTNYINTSDKSCLTTEEFVKISEGFNRLCEENGIPSKNNDIEKISNFCDADSLNSFVIDSEGYIYKCWQNIGVKSLSINNLVGNNNKNNRLYFDYLTYDVTEDKICKQCSYLPICMGGCPHNRRVGLERCAYHKYTLKDTIMDFVKEKGLAIT